MALTGYESVKELQKAELVVTASMSLPELEAEFDTVLVVDFGAQYAQLIARRVREAHVYSEIVPHTITAAELAAKGPKGVIFSGGPASVHADGAPRIDPAIYDAGIPVLGICYGGQLIARDLGGEVAKTGRGEYGRTELSSHRRRRRRSSATKCPREQIVWMSHFDTITAGARRLHRAGVDARRRRPPRSKHPTAASTACSSTPRSCTRPAARTCSSGSSTTPAAAGRRGR